MGALRAGEGHEMALRIERAVDDAVRIQVEDHFAPEDAWRIHEVVNEVALSLLAKDMLGGRVRIAALGLSHRHERLLGYLGVLLPRTAVPEEQ